VTTFVLVHGLGGTGATMEPLADLLQGNGHHTVLITLPGHGTEPESLEGVTWQQWLDAVVDAIADPPSDPSTAEPTVIIGQSMGGTLALAAAAKVHHLSAVVAINAPAPDPDAVDGLEWRQSRGHDWIDGPPLGDGEVGYTRFPIGALLEMVNGALAIDLTAVTCQVLLVNGALDEVVDPGSADVYAAALGNAQVRRASLAHTGHVATHGPQVAELAALILGG
jgi:carboxylesterase